MGCYKLTYDYEPTLFLESDAEKSYSVDLKVWSNPDTTFGGAGAIVLDNFMSKQIFSPPTPLAAVKAVQTSITITKSGLLHVVERHTVNALAKWAGKSKFYSGIDIPKLIKTAEQVTPTLQKNGNYERIVNAGRTIGVDRATGNPTSIFTVITDKFGNLVTAFPGRP